MPTKDRTGPASRIPEWRVYDCRAHSSREWQKIINGGQSGRRDPEPDQVMDVQPCIASVVDAVEGSIGEQNPPDGKLNNVHTDAANAYHSDT